MSPFVAIICIAAFVAFGLLAAAANEWRRRDLTAELEAEAERACHAGDRRLAEVLTEHHRVGDKS